MRKKLLMLLANINTCLPRMNHWLWIGSVFFCLLQTLCQNRLYFDLKKIFLSINFYFHFFYVLCVWVYNNWWLYSY
jgi:hypothetical protein